MGVYKMRSKYKILSVITLMTSLLLSACGASSASSTPSNSSVVQQKADRAANSAERRVDQHTDHKINNAIDSLFRKL